MEKNKNACARGYRACRISTIAGAISLTMMAADVAITGSRLSLDHVARLEYNFAGVRVPEWSGGALVDFTANQTAAPSLIAFDENGRQLHAMPFTIPGSELVDLWDAAGLPEGGWVVCGNAFDHSGRGGGFMALVDPERYQVTAARLYPYSPELITVASDGTIWMVGLEIVNAHESSANPGYGVLRHFDRNGKLLGSFLPRSSFSSRIVIQSGYLRSGKGRVGWYTGPVSGPGSQYIEVLSDGTVNKYPLLNLNRYESVDGLALLDNGRTYVTTEDSPRPHTVRLLSISAGDSAWRTEILPNWLPRVALYGGEGKRLVLQTPEVSKLTFLNVD